VLTRETLHKLARFLTVGGCAAAVDFSMLWLFSGRLAPMAAFSCAYATGVSTHFLLNKYWTFRCSRTDLLRQMGEYLVVAALCFCGQTVGFRIGLALFHHNIYLAKLIAIPPGTLVGFFLLKRRVFKGKSGNAGTS
jgi:putative flippase GtrA